MLHRGLAAAIAASALLLGACGAEDETRPEPTPPPPPEECLTGDLTLPDGSCQSPGVPPESCAPGFVSDGNHGCVAVLPPEPCPDGLIAVPGDEICREIAPCGADPWGDIPVDANTQYVDQAYAGPVSHGTAELPWTTIREAVEAAAPGAIVAIAAGLYGENVVIEHQPVRLWGRCPAMVEIHGAQVTPAVGLGPGANGSEVRSLTVSGGREGIAAWGAGAVTVDSVWLHDTGSTGIESTDSQGPTSVALHNVLIQRAHTRAMDFMGVDVVVESCAIRDTLPAPSLVGGLGIWVQDNQSTQSTGSFQMSGSLIEHSRDLGMFLGGTSATIEATLIRDTWPSEVDGTYGRALEIQDNAATGARPNVLLRGVVIERAHQEGVIMVGSDLTIEDTVIRDVASSAASGLWGRGLSVEPHPGATTPCSLILRRSVVERTQEQGIYVGFGTAVLESVMVRDTLPRASDLRFGRGMEVHDSLEGPASLDMRDCAIERTIELGILAGSNAHIERTRVIDVAVGTVEGLFGDGIDGLALLNGAAVTIVDCYVARAARVGIGAFGATMQLGSTALECNAIDLNAQDRPNWSVSFSDLGGNVCGCDGTENDCLLMRAELQAPVPVDPPE